VGEPAARELPLPELPPLQQQSASYRPRAVSRAGQIPQGYLSYGLAKQACELAHKRLCTEDEWVTACEGRHARKFPYGENFEAGRCNVYRTVHPAQLLHAASWYGHRDPRLNLVVDPVDGPLLRLTGATASCASQWDDDRIFDMVGNLDEWVEADPDLDTGVFVGGFYARSTREGCKARVSNHAKIYYDYSLGTRCCKNP
jgi:formylglycine-generating enzyme required for sulfatase activity